MQLLFKGGHFKNPLKCYLYNHWMMLAKNFKAIASVAVLVGMAKKLQMVFSDIYIIF